MLFFDLDGTLLDSNGVWLDIDVEFLGRQGISPVPADYTDYVAHHSAPDAARYTKERFGLPHSPQEILDAWMELAREAYAHTLPLKPGAKEFLLRCHQAGWSVAGVKDALFEGREAELQELCHYWVETFQTLPPELEKRIFQGET